MISVKEVIVVEGRYDKEHALSQVFDAVIVETLGLRRFQRQGEARASCAAWPKRAGLVVLTDSDGAGFVITELPEGRHRPRAREAGVYPGYALAASAASAHRPRRASWASRA